MLARHGLVGSKIAGTCVSTRFLIHSWVQDGHAAGSSLSPPHARHLRQGDHCRVAGNATETSTRLRTCRFAVCAAPPPPSGSPHSAARAAASAAAGTQGSA
eukprot:scaffold310006_cov30-Tisochrysis_lutea.AAC.1